MTASPAPLPSSPPWGDGGRVDALERATTADATSGARLRALVAMARSFAGARTVDEVVGRAAWSARTSLEADWVTVARWERGLGRLRALVHVRPEPGEHAVALPRTMAARYFPVLRDSGPAVGVARTRSDPDIDPVQDLVLARLGQHSCIEVPIVVDGKVWGLLYAAREAGAVDLGPQDLEFAMAVAGQVAAGLAQAVHFERIAALAYVDPLTGLANRRALDEQLDAAVDQHQRDGTLLGLILVDVNGLKQLNDNRGHKAGDGLLVETAGVLSAAGALLKGALVARLGGDEFCILVRGTEADRVIDAAREVCERAALIEGGSGVSCGVVVTSDPVGVVDTPSRLLRLADAAQYRAKRARATTPVVAGRRPEDDVAAHGLDAADLEAPHGDGAGDGAGDDDTGGVGRADRRAATRAHPDPMRLLREGLAALGEASQDGALARLELAAGATARLLDAASWWVSRVPPGDDVLRTAAFSVLRSKLDQADSQLGDTYRLADYPVSAAAVRGASYGFQTGDADSDPAEEAFMVAHGYAGVVAAGASDARGGWLVEVFTDEISGPVDGLPAVLRSLVAVALLTTPVD